MAVVRGMAGGRLAVFEDFSQTNGHLLFVDTKGVKLDLPKSSEPTRAEPKSLYRGHSLEEVFQSERDLLGEEILAKPGDPDYAEVAACIQPISKMYTYTFVGTHECVEKVGVFYGGSTPNFDPVAYIPAIQKIRDEGRVLDGLVGGWLPALRFVYPEKPGDWSELIIYAPIRVENGNQRGMLFSPQIWRELFKPRLARMFAVFRDAGLPVILHSDGDIWAILPDLIEVGLTCLNPVQPEVLQHQRLCREFGRHLSFYSGISTQSVLPAGTPARVQTATRIAMNDLAPDGIRVIICYTKSKRELAGSEYGQRRAQCEEGVRRLGLRALREISLKQFYAQEKELPAAVARRCRFIVEENDPVLQMAKALTAGDEAAIRAVTAAFFSGACQLSESARRPCWPSWMRSAGPRSVWREERSSWSGVTRQLDTIFEPRPEQRDPAFGPLPDEFRPLQPGHRHGGMSGAKARGSLDTARWEARNRHLCIKLTGFLSI
jgi:hypothetical protein